ncbi:MAG: peroxide stress protein YaaA [Fuerstiella sp.]
MLILISPAKTLDFESATPSVKTTEPVFLSDSSQLLATLKTLSPAKIGKLMAISDQLAELNYARFQQWSAAPSKEESCPAVYAFQGDVYQGLKASDWKAAQRTYAQSHLRILSGLYGLLRPMDSIMPYRLEMGRKLKTKSASNLYEFWGDQLADAINEATKDSRSNAIVNLASQEYFKAARAKNLSSPIITPVFKDFSNGKHKVISFFAKKARGMMADWIIRNKAKTPADLNQFGEGNYEWQEAESTESKPVFFGPGAGSKNNG